MNPTSGQTGLIELLVQQLSACCNEIEMTISFSSTSSSLPPTPPADQSYRKFMAVRPPALTARQFTRDWRQIQPGRR